VESAIEDLGRTGRGRGVMRDLLQLFDSGGVGLDAQGQASVRILLAAVWGPYTGSARDAMCEAVAGTAV
jgi:hypothetical protein